MVSRIRDHRLLDALDAIDPVEFEGTVWRVVRDGRDVLAGHTSGGRWDDGTFNVLYTSMERDGALAEMAYHLRRGQPVIPSKVSYRLYDFTLALERGLRFANLEALAAVGLDTARYGALSYAGRVAEYPRSQEIGEAAHMLGFDGLIVPNARADCLNVVVFSDVVSPDSFGPTTDYGIIDWSGF